MKFRKGTYNDVNSIYQSLSDEDKEYVTPGRRDYKDVPKNLAARQVAYDDDLGDLPVGFVDIYGPYAESKILRMPWAKPTPGYYTVETAVRESHRGRGLSPELAKRAVKKVLAQIVKNREDAKARGFSSIPGEPDKIKWNFLRGNEKSERAAIRSGFKRVGNGRYAFDV